MTRPEIHVCLANKVEAAWTAYHEKVLQLPSKLNEINKVIMDATGDTSKKKTFTGYLL